MTLPGSATVESHALWTLEVAGDLDVDPQPTVVAANSRHFTTTWLELTESGRVRLRERIQIGRNNERQGFWSGSLNADVDGSPLLRHRIELGSGSVTDDELGAPLACISELHDPDSDVDTAGIPLALAGGGCLATWQGQRLCPPSRFAPTPPDR
jgi:urease accessory protein